MCGIQQTIFATTDFPAMPQKFTQCKLCKKRVTCSNIWRHDARKYGYHNGQQKIRDLSLESLALRDVSITRSSVTPETDQVIDSDSERFATLCMLRPVERVNLPNLSRYLEIHFPGILAAFREPLIACTTLHVQRSTEVQCCIC